MNANLRTYVIGGTQIAVGLSAIVKFTPPSFMTDGYLKIASGGGTLELVAPPPALTGSSAAGWGAGYLVGGTEIVDLDGPAAFYMAATGEAMTVSVLIKRTAGATIT